MAPRFARLHGLFAGLCLTALHTAALAGGPLRYGVVDSMGYPFNVLDTQGRVTGGLLMDMGEKLAREMGVPLEQVTMSRRRVDPSLLRGTVDVVCYFSPQWSTVAQQLQWSVATLPQIERLVVPKVHTVPGPDDLAGKRIATQIGYTYPSLQPLFDAGRAKRVDESRVALMFKALDLGAADVLVTSEGEIEGYFHDVPDARERFEVSAAPFTSVPTQCALSPKSAFRLQDMDKALTRLVKRGDLERLARQYRMSMH